jgi:hypothetical protein
VRSALVAGFQQGDFQPMGDQIAKIATLADSERWRTRHDRSGQHRSSFQKIGYNRRTQIFLAGPDGMVPMPKRILLVSFDDLLLIEQRRLLEQQGYAVTSALRLKEAAARCKRGIFDLFILGRSIPHSIKKELIEVFRAQSTTPILSLWTPGEQVVDAVNYLEFSDSSDNFVKGVHTILTRENPSRSGEVFEA